MAGTMRGFPLPEKSEQRRGIILRWVKYDASSLFTTSVSETNMSPVGRPCRCLVDRPDFTYQVC